MKTSFPQASLATDFWRVNSYGYPCFFSESAKAQEAWSTLLSFFEYSQYDLLKEYWSSPMAPRKLSSHAVESWKATFEEFGILFVESRSNLITITPAGNQLIEAAHNNDKDEFAWIGLNLLLRYPLRGPRRPKSSAHEDADLLIYRFLYSALLDLDNYLWWTELEYILCRVFQTLDAKDAIDDVIHLRKQPELLSHLDLPAAQKKGAFYNSLNQVAVHAGMNHLILGSEELASPYGDEQSGRRQFIQHDWIGMIRKSLSSNGNSDQCATGGFAISRLPAAPKFQDEREYFDYLGAPVISMLSKAGGSLDSVFLQGEQVYFLTEKESHFLVYQKYISGHVASLCQLARGQRIVLSYDEAWTYIVEEKELLDANTVKVKIRRARPISNVHVIRSLRGEYNV